jgi:Flp pilus assembly protein TadD
MLYRQAADADPMQRDAWLGLAVIAHGANRPLEAGEFYKRVLRLDPQNGTALAGVASLNRAAQAPAEESRLRELLATSPQSPTLNHALGLAMATQSRWAEAQDLFFKAHALDANNPRYAFNLAVSLDRLHKSALAAQFYQRAIDLAQGNTRTGVDVDVARARLRAISAALAESKP